MIIDKLEALGKPYKIYAENLEQEAVDQFVAAMELDSVVKGALMPDAHTGYSLPIGCVVAVKDRVYPSFVGYDIGCGMCAMPFSSDVTPAIVRENANKIHSKLLERIPTGKKHHTDDKTWDVPFICNPTEFTEREYFKSGKKQLGTLGGGNHFIEIGVGEDDTVWAIIHSGSRNLGHKIATRYMKLAEDANGVDRGLDVLSEEGKDYLQDLEFALEFALENRWRMMRVIEKTLKEVVPSCYGEWNKLINRNHNHAVFKNGLWIHRKGATHAEEGMRGVIPANMRDGCFIVKGRGNEDSMSSSSHGAGRAMSRKKALQSITMEQFRDTMNESGVYATVTEGTLDESPFAYKDIFEVMRLQEDLVDIVDYVKPLINVKADEPPMDWKEKKKAMRKFKGEIPCV